MPPASMHDSADELRYFGPHAGWKLVDLPELWKFRDLLWVFTARDLKVRYRQTLVGIAWVVLQPLALLYMFQMLFSLLNVRATSPETPGEGASYAVSAYCGLLIWQLFAASVRDSTGSLVQHRDLLTKVYFPRMLLPASTIAGALVDFLVASVMLFLLMYWHEVVPGWRMLAAPLFLGLIVCFAGAVGIWLAALNALYRDIGHTVPFLLQIGFFVSPVVYETGALDVPAEWQWVFALNPVATAIEGMRWAMLGTTPLPAIGSIATSVALVAIALVGGLMYFNRAEQWISDRI